MRDSLLRKHGQNLLGDSAYRTTESQLLAMRDALSNAQLELQADMQSSIDRNNEKIGQLLAVVEARSAALKRMQRAVRAPTAATDSQQQQLSALQASLDEVRRKRDLAVGENNRLLQRLKELQVEVDGLKQLLPSRSSGDDASASNAAASGFATRSSILAVPSTSDAKRYLAEQLDADAQLEEMEALARKREGELQRMRKDAAQFDARYEVAVSELKRAQASAARRKIERVVSSQGRQEAECVKRRTERQAAATQVEQRAAIRERQEELHGAESEAMHRMLQASQMAMNRDGGTRGQRSFKAAAVGATVLDSGSCSGRLPPTMVQTVSDASSTPSASLYLQSREQDATNDGGRVDSSDVVNIQRGATVAEMAAWALLVRKAGVAEPRDVAERLAQQRSVEQTRVLERQAEVRLRQLVDEARVLRERHDWLETAISKAAARRRGELSESFAASSEQIETQSKQRAAHTAVLLRAQAVVRQLCARWPFGMEVTAEFGGEEPDAEQLAAILARLCASIHEARVEECAPDRNLTHQAAARTTKGRAAFEALLEAAGAAACQDQRAAKGGSKPRPASSAAARPQCSDRRPRPRDAVAPCSATHGRATLSGNKARGANQSTLKGPHNSVLDALLAANFHKLSLAAPLSISTVDPFTATDRLLGGLIISG
jgi:hypothetical protein